MVIYTLIVFHHVADVVAPGVVGFAHAHRVVREVDITVVAWDVWISDASRAGFARYDLQKSR